MPARLRHWLFGAALLGLAGCTSSTVGPAGDSTRMISSPPPSKPVEAPTIAPPAVVVPSNPVPSAPVTPEVVDALPTPSLSTIGPLPVVPKTWLPLENWTRTMGWARPRLKMSGELARYEVTGSNFVLTLTVGKNEAHWNGTEIWLGFAPRLIDGKPQIHGLDIIKTLGPLLQTVSRLVRPNQTIVLDPGHGGDQPGTRSIVGSHVEKEFTLDWAFRLKPLLEADGWTVWLTRTNDVDVPLSERVAVADRVHADLFLSLHFNSSSPSQEQSGLETYCLTPSGQISTLMRGTEDLVTAVLPNNAFDEQNVQWAYRLHRGVLQKVRTPDRGVRRARFMAVLRYQTRPAVLIEGGYLSNPREARLIGSTDYRQKLAEGVAAALRPDLAKMESEAKPVVVPARPAPAPVAKPPAPATNSPASEFTR